MADVKGLWLDLETTGLDPVANGVIEIGGIIEVNFKQVDEFIYKVRPFIKDEITRDALELFGFGRQEFQSMLDKDHVDPAGVFSELITKLERHINKFDKSDKFIAIGYNVGFDVAFLEQWFLKNNSKYFYSYFFKRNIDILNLARFLSYMGIIKTAKHDLKTIAEVMGITQEDWHSALDDIRVTRKIADKAASYMSDLWLPGIQKG